MPIVCWVVARVFSCFFLKGKPKKKNSVGSVEKMLRRLSTNVSLKCLGKYPIPNAPLVYQLPQMATSRSYTAAANSASEIADYKEISMNHPPTPLDLVKMRQRSSISYLKSSVSTTVSSLVDLLLDSIWYIKRTFQPSLIRRYTE